MTVRNPVVLSGRPTEAELTDQAVRRHLTAVIILAQQGSDGDVVRLARAETCRLVSAICAVLATHRLDQAGICPICAASRCRLLEEVRRALLPVRL